MTQHSFPRSVQTIIRSFYFGLLRQILRASLTLEARSYVSSVASEHYTVTVTVIIVYSVYFTLKDPVSHIAI